MYKLTKNLIAIFIIFFVSQNLFADTHYVSKTGGHVLPFTSWANAATNIQAAINKAITDDIVLVNDGTYFPTNEITVLEKITLKSVNGAEKTIVNGNGEHRCFKLGGANPLLDGFTITNGTGSGSGNSGGGVYCDFGGRIWNCIIIGNYASSGGGVGIWSTKSEIINSTIKNNVAGGYGGGGLHISSDTIVSNCIISGNTSRSYGGGVRGFYGSGLPNNNKAKVINCDIYNNTSREYGGGGVGGYCNLYDCRIYNNIAKKAYYQTSTRGGGISFSGSCINSIISNNYSVSNGGGVGSGYYINCVITCNTSVDDGAGVYSADCDRCIITYNVAGLNGGGVALGNTKNCLIYNNVASNYGGGVYFSHGGNINNSVIADNTSLQKGGGIYCDMGGLIKNSIIYYNTANNQGNDYYNYADGMTYEFCCISSDPGGTSIITSQPQFQNKTSYNYRLTSTSPCIDKGIVESWMGNSFDYYGNKRIANDFVDIGAHEYPLPEMDVGKIREDWGWNWIEIIQTNEIYNFGVIRSINTRTATLIITNRGTASLNLINTPKIQIGGINFDDFEIVQQPNTEIYTNSSSKFKIKFDPSDISSGTSSAYIIIANNDRNENPYKIFLEGIWGEDPTGLVTTVAKITGNGTESDPFDFGFVLIDHYIYANLKLTVKNASTYNLDIDWIEGSENFYCYNLESSISKNDSDVFSVEFSSYSTNEIETAKFAIKDDDFILTEFYVKARLVPGDLLPPNNVNATDGNYDDKVIVTWSDVDDATAYEIYRSESNNTSLAAIATTLDNTYTDLTATPGIKYYYKVKSTGIEGESVLSDSDSGYALVTGNETKSLKKWKYKSKNGKSKLNINGLGMIAPLANYLEDGCLVGLKDASNYETVDGPRELQAKKKKNGNVKFWFYNEKKEAVIKYIPNVKKPEKDKLIYKVWKDLPAEIIFFVQTSVESNDVSNMPIYMKDSIYEMYLTPDDFQINDWENLETK